MKNYQNLKIYRKLQYIYFTLKNVFHNYRDYKYLKIPNVRKSSDGIIVITHEADKRGAPILAGHIAKELAMQNKDVVLLSRQFGELSYEFSKYTSYVISLRKGRCCNILKKLHTRGYHTVILNTVVNGDLVIAAKDIGYRVVTLVQETIPAIKDLLAGRAIIDIINHSDTVVYPTNILKSEIEKEYGYNNHTIICPQGLYLKDTATSPCNKNEEMRVLAVGDVSYRKGFDIFIQAAELSKDKALFYWIGNGRDNAYYYETLEHYNGSFPSNFRFYKDMSSEDLFSFYRTANVFVLSSRYDTFPSVMLEAMSAGVPVVGFKESGGIAELVVNKENGLLVEKLEDASELLEAIDYFLHLSTDESNIVKNKCIETADSYSFDKYVCKILSL